jgi:hypothetical protein
LLNGDHGEIAFAPRTAFEGAAKARPLVLWSIPPSPQVLQWLVETAAPSSIYLCGRSTGDDTVQGVLRAVGGMCKYALAHDGLLNLARMAARLGLTEAIIRTALLWLARRGLITLAEWEPANTATDSIRIGPADGVRQEAEAELLQAQLEEQLAEVRAYRRYFLRARVSELGLSTPH